MVQTRNKDRRVEEVPDAVDSDVLFCPKPDSDTTRSGVKILTSLVLGVVGRRR